ncbi:hypothetical protein D5F01_LYC24725 [Larimichthys crocea]|uniref:Uncharacterized protein n=1 Tax=Larimichthys crocea TaxID=215358 RepID=A0A6G0HDP5_LARCR|nr:hypothetical protein D5F01_LYC24725 [Larimichthys crocea]
MLMWFARECSIQPVPDFLLGVEDQRTEASSGSYIWTPDSENLCSDQDGPPSAECGAQTWERGAPDDHTDGGGPVWDDQTCSTNPTNKRPHHRKCQELGHNTCLILMEHYEKCLEEFLEDLSGFLTPDWKGAFEVAVRWARKNLPRISQDAIDHTEALIAARLEGRNPIGVPQQQTTTASQTQDPAQDQPKTRDPARVPRGRNATSAQTQDQAQKVTVATNTGDQDQQPRDQTDWFQVPPPSSSTAGDPPQDQREVRGRHRRIRGAMLTEDSIVEDPEPTHQDDERETLVHHSPTHSELEALFDELHEEEEEGRAGASTPQGSVVRTVAQVHRESDEEAQR